MIVERASLRGVAVVDRPAYTDAVIDKTESNMSRRISETNDDEGREDRQANRADPDQSSAVDEILEILQSRDEAANAEELAARMETLVDQRVSTAVQDAFAQRDESEAQRRKAEADKEAAETRAREEKEATETRVQEERQEAADAAEQRTEIIMRFGDLLPDDYEQLRGQDAKALLMLAVGDEVENAESRSEDYLTAKAEGIAERRAQANRSLNSTRESGKPAARKQTSEHRPVDILGLKRARREQGA